MLALTGAIVHTGEATLTGHAVLIEDGVIAGVAQAAEIPGDATIEETGGGHIAPGFIDLQVNGGGGVMFNDNPTAETIRRIAEAHRAFGVTGLLPTFITGPADDMARAADATAAALESVPGVLGTHFEGPHINPDRAGVHDPAMIRPCTAPDLEILLSVADGCTLVTLAPECVDDGTIAALAGNGAVVAAGHTLAGPDELTRAADAGLTGVTHLFNAMAQMGSREPGTVGAALADNRLWCSVIADGHHVHPASLGAAWRAKPPGGLLLVSDAMSPVGAPAMTTFETGGHAVQVGDGRCVTEDGRLAGSLLSVDAAVRYCVHTLGVDLDEALRMASTYPARVIGEDEHRGRIAPGFEADLVLLNDNLVPQATWIGGQKF